MIFIQVDALGIVTEFIGIGTSTFQNRNLSHAVGWHESYLNSLTYAYESGLVADWIAFFGGEWMSAICHDKFSGLVNTLRENLNMDVGVLSVIESVTEVSESTDEDALVAGERRRIIGDRGSYVPEVTRKTVENHTLEFLRKHRSMLTRFQVPIPGVSSSKFSGTSENKTKK